MHECVILYRRTDSGHVEFVANGSFPAMIAVYPHQDAAVDYCLSNRLFTSGQADYQIVELDEL